MNIPPFVGRENVKHVVSVSGGKDSGATYLEALERTGGDFIAICADTGNEHPETLEYVSRLAWAHRATLHWWALENPVGKLVRYLGKPLMRFNPCDYGDPYTKRTCLWGSFTPPLPLILGKDLSVSPTEGSKMHTQYGGRSQATKNARSATPLGFARAFFDANQ